jgi:mono/diheme cytochrome c family protein
MRIAKFAVIVLAGFAAFVFAMHHGPRMAESVQAAEQSSGRGLYEKNCAKCHGADGQAKSFRGKMTHARNIANADWQANNTDQDIVDAIKDGPKSMPSFSKKLSDAQINAVVRYVRTLKR